MRVLGTSGKVSASRERASSRERGAESSCQTTAPVPSRRKMWLPWLSVRKMLCPACRQLRPGRCCHSVLLSPASPAVSAAGGRPAEGRAQEAEESGAGGKSAGRGAAGGSKGACRARSSAASSRSS